MQNNNNNNKDFRPIPKYKQGDFVKLKSGREGRIWFEPKWNDWCDEIKPQWMYEYEYGITGSEGFVIEEDILSKIN